MLVRPMAINYSFWSSLCDQCSPVFGQQLLCLRVGRIESLDLAVLQSHVVGNSKRGDGAEHSDARTAQLQFRRQN